MRLLAELVSVNDIDTPKEFAALAMVLLSPIVASVAAAWGTATFAHRRNMGKTLGVIADDTGAIREQTENSHNTNLRDDVDRVGERIEDAVEKLADLVRDLRGLRQDIGGLRGELRDERQERLDFQQHITEQLRDSR